MYKWVTQKCPKNMFRKYDQCCFMKIQVHVDEMHNKVTQDYRKFEVNNTALLYHACMPFEVGGKTVNINQELAGHSQQLVRSMLSVRTLVDTCQQAITDTP